MNLPYPMLRAIQEDLEKKRNEFAKMFNKKTGPDNPG
jgi:hypothetical protein